jgi:hypothetical protein
VGSVCFGRIAGRRGSVLALALVVAGLVGAADKAEAITAYALTATNQLVRFDTEAPDNVDPAIAITGLQPGESIVAIHFDDRSSLIYGIGSTGRLYVLNGVTGRARQVGAGTFAVPLTGTAFGFTGTTVPNRARIVSNSGLHLLIDLTTAAVLAEPALPFAPNGIAGAASVEGDILLVPDTVNDVMEAVDTSDNSTLGSMPFGQDLSSPLGWDMDTDTIIGVMVYRDGGVTTLALYDPNGGTLVDPEPLGDGSLSILGLTLIDTTETVWMLSDNIGSTSTLIRINSRDVALGGPQHIYPVMGSLCGCSEWLVGIAVRPATGVLYGLSSESLLYRIDPDGTPTLVSATPFGPQLLADGYGLAFDPVRDQIRVIEPSGLNYRLNPDTGQIIDSDPITPGVQLDGDLSGPFVKEIAYSNAVPGAASTTLFGLTLEDGEDPDLVLIGGPGGTPSPDTGGIVGDLDLFIPASTSSPAVGGFDISPFSGRKFITFTDVFGSGLWAVDAKAAFAVPLGDVTDSTFVRGLAIASRGRAQFSAATIAGPETDSLSIAVLRTADTAGVLSVDYEITGGTATSGADYTPIAGTLTFQPGESQLVLQLPLVDDGEIEGDETVTIALSPTLVGVPLGAIATITATIQDDDHQAPTISITAPTTLPTFGIVAETVALSGTAADDQGIASVTWSNHRGGSGAATGTTSWSIPSVALELGANAITVTATDTRGKSRSATLVVTRTQQDGTQPLYYYLAEGATGPFFSTEILLANPNAQPAEVAIEFLTETGDSVTLTRTLPPESRTTIPVGAIPGLESAEMSTVVRSLDNLPLVVERTMTWDRTGYGSHTEKAVEAPAATWYFAEGSLGFFQTYLLLANPNPVENEVTVQFLLENGPPVTQTFTVARSARRTIDLSTIEALRNQSFGTTVTFTHPGIAERAMYFGTPLFNGGHESVGVTAPAASWFLAEGATGDFFDTFLLVANPNGSEAHVTLTYLPSTGVPIARERTIAPFGRLTVNLEIEDAALANAAVATTVESDVPVVAERAMYWPGGAAQWIEAHGSFGVTATGTRWGLAEGRVGGANAAQTYILLANSGSEAANVTITYLRSGGAAPVVKTYTVQPTSRYTVYVNRDVPELIDESFGARIESSEPIAVERALYSNAGGVLWAAGTNATATRLP